MTRTSESFLRDSRPLPTVETMNPNRKRPVASSGHAEKNRVRGKYHARYREGFQVILDPDPLPVHERVFAADLWSYHFGDPNERYRATLTASRSSIAQLVDYFLLYETVVVPTQDFLSLSVLSTVLSDRALIELLEQGKLSFLRLRGGLAYVGNGGGIQPYTIRTHDGRPDPFSGPIDDAVSWALSGLNKMIDPALAPLVLANVTEVDVHAIADQVRRETYKDVLDSEYLRRVFSLRNRDVLHLSGVGPKDVRIYGGPTATWRGDEVDIVLAIAAVNVEFRLAQIAACVDTSTASPVGHLLKAKAQRSFEGVTTAFAELREIAGLPNIGDAVLEQTLELQTVLALARSSEARAFREWFHANCRDNPLASAREYANLLGQMPLTHTFPARILRFLASTGGANSGGAANFLDVAAGTSDSFVLDRWLKGSSPKFYIESMNQLARKTTEAAAA